MISLKYQLDVISNRKIVLHVKTGIPLLVEYLGTDVKKNRITVKSIHSLLRSESKNNERDDKK